MATRGTKVWFCNAPFDRDHRICYYPRKAATNKPKAVFGAVVNYAIGSESISGLNWIENIGTGSGTFRIQAPMRVAGGGYYVDEEQTTSSTSGSYFGRANYAIVSNAYTFEDEDGTNTTWNEGIYYVFIDSVKALNAYTLEVSFTVDNVMTYYSTGLVNLGECLVERETVSDDTVGKHIEPENIPLGEYIYANGVSYLYGLTDMCICVQFFTPDAGEDVNGELLDGIFSGGTIRVYPTTTGAVGQIKSILTTFLKSGKADDILMYMAPSAIMNGQSGVTTNSDGSTTIPDEGVVYTNKGSATSINYILSTATRGESIGEDNYTPKNKKLFTYPYNFLRVTNNNGGILDLRYEFFLNNPEFIARICGAPPVTVTLTPTAYGGSGTRNPDLMLSLSDYPLCSWSADSFSRWVASNRGQLALSLMSGVASMAGGAAMMVGSNAAGLTSQAGATALNASEGQGAKSGKTGLDSIIGVMAGAVDASRQGSYISGTRTNGNLQFSSGTMNFSYGRMSVTSAQAKVIDNYFSLYGYAVNIAKKPSPNNRKKFDFIKTRGANIGAGNASISEAPNNAIEEIISVLDAGAWFIHSPNTGGKCYGVEIDGNDIDS